jgi:hypothetical protein
MRQGQREEKTPERTKFETIHEMLADVGLIG